MKKRKRAAIGLLVLVYAVGVAVAITVFGSEARYDCYNRRGLSGVLWCPESARQSESLFRRSVLWPYYAWRAVLP